MTSNDPLKCLLGGNVVEGDFGFNHKIIINVQESPPNILRLLGNLMVCESLDKRLVVQRENISPSVHPT